MMGYQHNLGFSPLQLGVGTCALVTGVYYFDNNSFKASIEAGLKVGASILVVYSIMDAII